MVLPQQVLDFAVADLREVAVPFAYCKEGFRNRQTDKVVRFPAKTIAGLLRSNGDCYDDACSMKTARVTNRRHHGASRGKPVINQNCRFSMQVERRLALAIEFFTPPHLRLFAC